MQLFSSSAAWMVNVLIKIYKIVHDCKTSAITSERQALFQQGVCVVVYEQGRAFH